jgi:plastocyanin domain-containing protein
MTWARIMVDLVGLVKGGYTPDLIVVEAGKPVRLWSRRWTAAW